MDRETIKRAVEEAQDPWVHRSRNMSCATCMWFSMKSKRIDIPFPGDSKEVGRCRRHAPTISGYPVVFLNDWCGDHKVDENKV